MVNHLQYIADIFYNTYRLHTSMFFEVFILFNRIYLFYIVYVVFGRANIIQLFIIKINLLFSDNVIVNFVSKTNNYYYNIKIFFVIFLYIVFIFLLYSIY